MKAFGRFEILRRVELSRYFELSGPLNFSDVSPKKALDNLTKIIKLGKSGAQFY